MDPQNKDSNPQLGPGTPPGEKGDKASRMYTSEEVEARLVGSGKVIQGLQEKLKQFEEAEAKRKEEGAATKKKQLEEQGKYKELLEAKEKAEGQLMAELKALKEREEARIARINESNEKRIKALPKKFQELVTPGLDPDSIAELLTKLEAMEQSKTVSVHGGGGRQETPSTPEDFKNAQEQKGHNWIFGNKDKKKQ